MLCQGITNEKTPTYKRILYVHFGIRLKILSQPDVHKEAVLDTAYHFTLPKPSKNKPYDMQEIFRRQRIGKSRWYSRALESRSNFPY